MSPASERTCAPPGRRGTLHTLHTDARATRGSAVYIFIIITYIFIKCTSRASPFTGDRVLLKLLSVLTSVTVCLVSGLCEFSRLWMWLLGKKGSADGGRHTRFRHGTHEVRTQGHSNGDELREALRRRCTPGRSRPGYSGLGLGLVIVVAAVVVTAVAALAAAAGILSIPFSIYTA